MCVTPEIVRGKNANVCKRRLVLTVARVEHNAGRTAGRVEREDGLDGDVHGRRVERLEHDLRHLLAIGLRVERRLRKEDRVLLGRNAKLVVERVTKKITLGKCKLLLLKCMQALCYAIFRHFWPI